MAQKEAPRRIGCGKLFEERTSSVSQRSPLDTALKFVREGDSLIVTKLDRLARSVRHDGEIVDAPETKRAGLKVPDLGLDRSGATGKAAVDLDVATGSVGFDAHQPTGARQAAEARAAGAARWQVLGFIDDEARQVPVSVEDLLQPVRHFVASKLARSRAVDGLGGSKRVRVLKIWGVGLLMPSSDHARSTG
jgi:DNA invertase Pin-like site-specific DNA recombinase